MSPASAANPPTRELDDLRLLQLSGSLAPGEQGASLALVVHLRWTVTRRPGAVFASGASEPEAVVVQRGSTLTVLNLEGFHHSPESLRPLLLRAEGDDRISSPPSTAEPESFRAEAG